jgi:hypothetical protein
MATFSFPISISNLYTPALTLLHHEHLQQVTNSASRVRCSTTTVSPSSNHWTTVALALFHSWVQRYGSSEDRAFIRFRAVYTSCLYALRAWY